jgi:acetyl-CoA acetyltransferase
MPTQNAPESVYRKTKGLGLWEHKGKAAAVGIGHSPAVRRWDEKPETSLGAFTIMALRNAIADAGVSPDQIDGLVMSPDSLGEPWSPRPVPEDFAKAFQLTDDPNDGLSKMSPEFVLKNMPELTNINFTMFGPTCMSNALNVASQAIGDGQTHTCLVVKGCNNLEGRYGQYGAAAAPTVGGSAQWVNLWGATGPYYPAYWFNKYTEKYGGSHDQMAPFVVNSKANGLLFPEGFFAQNRPEPITIEDYLSARWIVKPVNLYDCDIPMCVSVAYLFTTAERAKDMKQTPVYVLSHADSHPKYRGVELLMEECEEAADNLASVLFEGAGITAKDLSFENMYDGYTLFHQFMLEGLGFAGVKKGEALDFYQTDISIHGPHPVSPSGGNAGSGRTRIWQHTDSIQQLQGRAGARQITGVKPEVGVSGGPHPRGGNFMVWSTSPD